MHPIKNILVICTGNSCRSQMAEGYLRKFLFGRAYVYSAGIEAHGLNARAVQVMHEDNVDISKHTSDRIEKFQDMKFDMILTVCDAARESCPIFPGKGIILHESFPDPAKATGSEEEIMIAFRSVRDQIREFSRNLVLKSFG